MIAKRHTCKQNVDVTPNSSGRWAKFACVAICAFLLWNFREPAVALLGILADRQAVAGYLDQFGIFGPILLAGVLVLQVIVAAIPGHALMIGGAFVYGFGPAFLLNLATTVTGSQLAFLLARRAGRPIVTRLAPADVLARWDRASEEKGLTFFLFAFMLPIFPADVMNYVAGLSTIPARHFLVANLVGRLPGVLLMTAIGAFGFQLSPIVWVGIALVAAVLFTIWRLVFAVREEL